MRIRGQELDINFEEELEGIEFTHAKIRDNKIQACSPFRDDTKPSFAINLSNGLWIDSGADLDHMKKGNIVSFLAYIKGCSFEEIEDYLIEKYSIDFKNTGSLSLKINLKPLKMATVDLVNFETEYKYSRYLDKIRGIDTNVQELFETFETVKDGKNVIGMPWADKSGRIINIKYRCTDNKSFFYEELGEPIKYHLFGLDKVLKYRPSEVWVVESEIDALYLWSNGIYAVALGRASYNDKQLKLLRKIGADIIVIATDNDPVGIAVKEALIKELLPYVKVQEFIFPEGIKDINDMDKKVFINKENLLKNVSLLCKI